MNTQAIRRRLDGLETALLDPDKKSGVYLEGDLAVDYYDGQPTGKVWPRSLWEAWDDLEPVGQAAPPWVRQ